MAPPRAWLGDGRDLFVVGDPRQAIYGWNGADPTLLDRLPDLLPGTTVLRLDDNHRSTPQVSGAARGRARAPIPDPASRPDGPFPVVDGFDDDDAEAAAVARWLRRTHRPGRPWSHLAVLARTNARLDPVARALERAGIPYRIGGGARRRPRRGPRWPSSAGLRRPAISAAPWPSSSWPARREGSGRVAPHATMPERSEPRGLASRPGPLADEHAARVPRRHRGRVPRLGRRRRGRDMELDGVDGVELSTFHRAKGLEWPAVAVVGLEDGMVPIAYATTPDAVAEERRLLYVALTRAEDELWCSWAAHPPGRRPDVAVRPVAAPRPRSRKPAGTPVPRPTPVDSRRGSPRCGPCCRARRADARTQRGPPYTVDVDEHRGVVRGLLALAGVAVDEGVGDTRRPAARLSMTRSIRRPMCLWKLPAR